MHTFIRHSARGASTLEYALLLALVALILIAAVVSLSLITARNLGTVSSTVSMGSEPSAIQRVLAIIADWHARMLAYYQKYGSWPRTFSPYNFTDIGLNPADWSQPIDGLYLSPHGSEVGIANRTGDNIQVYVKDLNGNTLHLYDGWGIWCPVNSSSCYYHTVAPGNEVKITTIYTTGQ